MDPVPLSRAGHEPEFLLRRRAFLKSLAAGAALPTVAGPFLRMTTTQVAPAQGAGSGDPGPDHFVPADKKLAPEWLARLREKGVPTVYRGPTRAAAAMPCGGIGVGQLYVGGDGTLRTWQLFNQHVFSGWGQNNYQLSVPPRVVEHGFAVAVHDDDGEVQVKRLREEDAPDVEMVGEYPVADFTYPAGDARRGGFPIEAKLQVFSPFIPLNAEDSTLPVTLMRVTLKNVGEKPRRVSLLSWLENAVAPVHGDLLGAIRRNKITHPSSAESTATRSSHLLFTARIDVIGPGSPSSAPPELFADFEGAGYGQWKVEGTAFGAEPSAGTEKNQQQVSGFEGKGLVNTFRPDDAPQGTLTSPLFTIRRRYVNFRIGGGDQAGKTCLNLVIDGNVVASAAGRNREALEWAFFDVQALQGKAARLQIVDASSAGWGHVNVDQIEFADTPRLGAGGPLETQDDYGSLGWLRLRNDDPRTPRVINWAAFADQGQGVGGGPELDGGALNAFVRSFHDNLAKLGGTDRPTLEGRSTRPVALLGETIDLAAGDMRTFDFALLWHFPNHPEGRWYASRFPDLEALASYVVKEHARLVADTLLWRDTYYRGSLPQWLLERLHAPVANLATDTTQVWKNGRFWAWEGVGCCEGTCTHVWNYEHALARLFPSLARSTREQQDLGVALHEDGLVGYRGADVYAADGQCGTVLKCYREYLMSPDEAFLRRQWPRIKRVMEYALGRDGNDDGLMEDNQHNTYDIEFFGPNTFVGSLYLAALRAAEEMARRVGETHFALRCRKVFESGSRLSVERLWNGEYFVQKVDLEKHPQYQYADGCLADQLFGQGWARQVGLGDLYPREVVLKALRSIWTFDWAPDVGPQTTRHLPERYFARQGEAGLLVCTWPKSRHPGNDGVRYRDEVWTGIEYQVAGHMAWDGMVEEALAIVRGIHERYDGRVHNPWNEIECGDHYARALASWGVYLGLCGFEYDGPAGVLGFAPRLDAGGPGTFQAAFTAAAGWGSLEQRRVPNEHPNEQHNGVRVRWGSVSLNELAVELPDDSADWSARARRIGGDPGPDLPHELERDGREARVRFEAPVTFRAGETLAVVFSKG